MTNSRWLHALFLSVSLLASACVADSATSNSTAGDPTEQAASPTFFRMMRIRNSSTAASDPAKPAASDVAAITATPHLGYWGGPIINGIPAPIWWNSSTPFASDFAQFYPAVVTSPLWSMLSQYGIKFGSATPIFTDNRPTANVTDAGIQTELNNLISAGKVPAPTANTYYPIHFPPGMAITAPDGSMSCVVFCAYHSSFVRNGVNVYYGVIPYVGALGCAGNCGGNTTILNNEFAVASKELVEATTDPAVGQATVFGPPLAWYDPHNGEIGDICNGIQGTTAGFVVQKEWSNAANACVDR